MRHTCSKAKPAEQALVLLELQGTESATQQAAWVYRWSQLACDTGPLL